jgi:hypothetical protein
VPAGVKTERTPDVGIVPLPSDLPAPLARHFRSTLGEHAPKIETAIWWGTARMRLGRVWLPLRFQTAAVPGRAFTRRMQLTWFSLPVLKGSDTSVDGEGALTIGSVTTCGIEIDQGENLALWAEALLTPTVLLSDPRLRWEAVGSTAARLIVPFGFASDQLLFRIDPQTGRIRQVSAERYRQPDQPKEGWSGEYGGYKPFHGVTIPTELAVTWDRDGRPWSYWRIEGMEFNVRLRDVLPIPSPGPVGSKAASSQQHLFQSAARRRLNLRAITHA